MTCRLLILLLGLSLLTAGFSAAPQPVSGSCCLAGSEPSSCLHCGKAPATRSGCCAAPQTVLLFLSRQPLLVFRSNPTAFPRAGTGFPARKEEPAVPPPKRA